MRWFDVAEWSNVEDMYKYASRNSLNLLSDYSATFWQDYLDNHARYDKQFMRMYKSYRYYMQNPYDKDNETLADITEDFIDAVYMHLKMNDKKYSELYRMNVLDDSELSPLNDYNITEIMDGTKAYTGTYVDGARNDTNSETQGARTDVTIQQIEGFNSSEFSDSDKSTTNYGGQSNSGTFGKGEQENTDEHSEDNDYTLTKTGNVTNPYESLKKFKAVWSDYDFMNYIFKNICAELLLV